MEVEWVFQRLEDVPQGVEIPEGRQKPWGTGQATLAAARVLEDTPYAVINADDFYGREAVSYTHLFFCTPIVAGLRGEINRFAILNKFFQKTSKILLTTGRARAII